jgi:glycosyltransferase involved in cell wall biosynthesis
MGEDNVKVSILLPIKNAEETLDETILSILTQDFDNFELLCVVAPSQDSSLAIAQKWASTDMRIKVYLDAESSGIAGQCNFGLSIAKGEYIAICNADDLNMPNRFLAQILYLDKHKNVGVVGSDILTFGKIQTYWRMPSHPEEIKATMLFRGAIANPSAMFRRSILEKNEIRYDNSFESAAEDLDLWVKLSKVTELRNLNFPLVRYRVWERQATSVNGISMSQNAARVRLKLLQELGFERFDRGISVHEAIAKNEMGLTEGEVKSWFKEIELKNQSNKIYDHEALRTVMEKEYFRLFSKSPIFNAGRVYRFKWISNILSRMPIKIKIKIARIIGL